MKKLLKISLIVLVVIIGSLIAIPYFFKSQLIDMVKKEINKSVNAKVEFSDVSLSLFRNFPDFSFGLHDLTVINNAPFEGDTLMSVEKFYLTLDLASVFSGESYEVKGITIKKPLINLVYLEDGAANYDITIADTAAVEEETEASESAFVLTLKKLIISDARINYVDKSSDMAAFINDFDLNLKGDFTETTTDMVLDAAIASLTFEMEGIDYLKKATINLDANLAADLDAFKFTFKDNELIINRLPLFFEGWVAMPDDDISMDLLFKAPQADFKKLLSLIPAFYMTDMEGLKADGKVAFAGFAKGVYNDDLMPAFGVDISVENGRFQYPDLPQSVDEVNMKMSVQSPETDMDKMIINMEKLNFSVAKNPMSIRMLLKTPLSDPDIDAAFKGKLNLADVGKFYPLDTGMTLSGLFNMDVTMNGKQSYIDNEQYSAFKSSGVLSMTDFKYADADLPEGVEIATALMEFTPRYIELKNFAATYMKNSVTAYGKLSNYFDYMFGDGVLFGKLDLKSDFLNIDEIMGSEGETEATETIDSTAETPMEVVLIPENIHFELQTLIGRIRYDKIDIQSVYGKVVVADQRLNLENLNMELLDGKMGLSGFYSTLNPEKPNVSMLMEIHNFNIPKAYEAFNTIQSFAPLAKYIKGSFSGLVNFNSDLDMAMNPEYNSMDVEGMLKTSALAITGSPAFSKLASQLKYDKFNNVSTKPVLLSFAIQDGTLEVEPFEVVIDEMPATVSGTAKLDKTIDYQMNMDIPSQKLGASANNMISQLNQQASSAGLNLGNTETIPVKVLLTGPANNPDVKVAVTNPAQDIQDQLEEKVKEEIKKAEEQLKDEIEKKKKEVLDEAEKLKKQAQDSLNSVIQKQKEELERQKKEAEEKAKKKLEQEAKDKLKKLFG